MPPRISSEARGEEVAVTVDHGMDWSAGIDRMDWLAGIDRMVRLAARVHAQQ